MAASATAHDELHDTTTPDIDDDAAQRFEDDDTTLQTNDKLVAGEIMAEKLGFEGSADDLRELRVTGRDEWTDEMEEHYQSIMRVVQLVGGAVIGIAIVTLVVNEVLTVDAINNSSGPFSGVIDSLETTGVAAMTLLVVGLLVVAASQIMNFFGGGF